MTVLVDSDILIEVCRARNREILSRWAELADSEDTVIYFPVTAAKLWAGARPREYEALTELFRELLCAPIDEGTGRQAGDYLREYARTHGVELGDALIAATAVLNHAELWARNHGHYPRQWGYRKESLCPPAARVIAGR